MTRAATRARRLVLILAAAGAAAALAWGLAPGPVPCELASVTRGPLSVTLEEDGMTRVVDRYTVAAPVAGYLRRIQLDPGDPVAAGQTLATLEPLRSEVLDPRTLAEARARKAAAEAALAEARQQTDAAQAADDYAQAQLQRAARLFSGDFVPRDALDKAETDARAAAATLKSARFAVRVAQHELAAAAAALDYAAQAGADAPARAVALPSPVDGRVLRVLRRSEGVVPRGQDLLEIGDPRALEVEVDVLSEDAVRIRPGSAAQLLRWGGPGALQARVRTVEPTGSTKISALGVEEQRVLVIADITSQPDDWERLGDGYRVEASFLLWHGDDVPQVPSGALFRDGGRWAVFTVQADTARLTGVEIGHQGAQAAEIIAGLQPGDTVIVHPSDAVADGVRVRARE